MNYLTFWLKTQIKFTFLILVSALVVSGCARSLIRSPEQAMRPSKQAPSLSDDMELTGLIAGLEANLLRLREVSASNLSELRFGPRTIQRAQYIRALERLLQEAKSDVSGEQFRKALREGFEPFEVYGQNEWGEVFITSYFEPVIEGSLAKTDRFRQPLFSTPKNMIEIDLESFAVVRPSLLQPEGKVLEQRSRRNYLRGFLQPGDGKGLLPRVVAFPDRATIDSGILKDQSEVLAWVDPIDAFFLEIQGSGVVKLPNGQELKVGYASQNGHPYVPIGKFLIDKIPLEKLSLHTIESHLRSLPEPDARRIMQRNPSYVFFRPLKGSGVTYFGSEVVTGRTIATDQSFFPKGTLAFLEFERPVFESSGAIEPNAWKRASRFVLDQDTGGAIRGPHRVDLFWGRGPEAKQHAGVIKGKGRLVYFVPREEWLRRGSQ